MSLEFNLKSRIFCELFPDIKSECEKELERRRSQEAVASNDNQVSLGGYKQATRFIVVCTMRNYYVLRPQKANA